MARNCGECLMETVEVVELKADGVCPRCGTNYGPDTATASPRITSRTVQATPTMYIEAESDVYDGRAVKVRAGNSFSRLSLEELEGLRDDINATIEELKGR